MQIFGCSRGCLLILLRNPMVNYSQLGEASCLLLFTFFYSKSVYLQFHIHNSLHCSELFMFFQDHISSYRHIRIYLYSHLEVRVTFSVRRFSNEECPMGQKQGTFSSGYRCLGCVSFNHFKSEIPSFTLSWSKSHKIPILQKLTASGRPSCGEAVWKWNHCFVV